MAQITLRNYLQETEDAISSKRVDEAFASCQYILAYFPESLETQRLLGEVYLAQGKLDDAQQAFDWVLTNDPENVVAYCSRALVSERLSDHDTALDCYQQAYELSRGNSQIRQAFNQLSEKAGQPGFMLSRAGLARLYMRGDLLSQAAQEWDIVLAMTPDRLDARTGLLEVYWRLGIYDRAAQLAEQILQDVPGCVKALLLLAYVTAPQDMLRSQELVKKAEVVDPDLVMAHDLFADQMVSRQGDPFLKLLSKPPVALSAGDQAAPTTATQNANSFASLNSFAGTVSPDALASWGDNSSWSNDATLVKPRSDTAFPANPAANASPSWMSESLNSSNKPSVPAESNSEVSTSQWGSEPWKSASLSQSTPLQEEDAAQVEPWDSLQDALNNISPEVAHQISDPGLPAPADVSWLGTDALAAPSLYAENTSNDTQNVDENINASFAYGGEDSWSFATPAENGPNSSSSTPAWLNMLTQNEQQVNMLQSSDFSADPMSLEIGKPDIVQPQVSSSPLPVSQVQPQQVAPPSPPPVAQVQPQQVAPPSQTASEEMPAWARKEQPDADVDEEIFFGPDWLKTLGAASLDGAEPFDFLVPEEEAPVAHEQPVTLEPKPEEASVLWEQPELQTASEKNEEPSYISSSEEPQNTSEEDAWASWQPASSYSAPADQEAYQPWPDLSKQPQDDQSFWSLPQQENPALSSQEQPSWMSQLSQSSQGKPASEYTDWTSQSSESWSVGSPEIQIPEELGSQGYQSTSGQTYSDDPWTMPAQQPAPQEEQDPWTMSTQQPAPQEEQDPWAQLNQQVQSQSIDYNWLAQLAGNQQSEEPAATQEESVPKAISELSLAQQNVPSNQEKTEQDLITTLEELEQNLLSHGFMQLEPNSLANIAQASREEYSDRYSNEENFAIAESEQAEPSLSSALAELGNLDRTEVSSIGAANNEPYFASKLENRQEQVQPSEPLWLSALGTTPDIASSFVAQVTTPKPPAEEMTVRGAAMPDSQRVRQPTNPLLAVPYAENDSAFVPTNPAPVPAPATQMNVLLDSELETTMKRPAVRLQPMQQQATPRDHSGNSHSSRSRTGERTGQRLPDSKGNVSYRERLVRGYQSQLIGDFDEAMQEYRLIIRNAPELLGEVVSNVRALLKLAPNYSAGYRVLGDAYMRQGEYLQAMESYNKALTMAKKAKS